MHYQVENFSKELEQLDLQLFVDQIKELLTPENKAKQPILILCVNGMLSGALAIRLTMEYNKTFTRELAMAYVAGKRYELKDMPNWLYQMIEPKDDRIRN